MIDIARFVHDYASSTCIHSEEYECDEQESYYACIPAQIKKHDAEIKAEAIDEFVKFAYENGIDFSFMGKIKEDGTSDVPDKLNAIKFKFIEWLNEEKE